MKIIDKKKAQQDPYVAKNFRREAKLLQMVCHPNILQLLEVIETDSSFYLITELCSGELGEGLGWRQFNPRNKLYSVDHSRSLKVEVCVCVCAVVQEES